MKYLNSKCWSDDTNIKQYRLHIIDIWINAFTTHEVPWDLTLFGNTFTLLYPSSQSIFPQREATSQPISSVSSWENIVRGGAVGSMSLPGFLSPSRKNVRRWWKLPFGQDPKTLTRMLQGYFFVFSSRAILLNILLIMCWPLVDLEAWNSFFACFSRRKKTGCDRAWRRSTSEKVCAIDEAKRTSLGARGETFLCRSTPLDLSCNVITRITTYQLLSGRLI